MHCPACAFECDASARFCSQCGTPLAAPVKAPLEDERRQLTVMFCDLVESTELARSIDPEDLREAVRSYHEACERIAADFDAAVAQYLGDGALIYFGHPQAHEDDPDRAARAALRILDETPRVNARLTRRIPQLKRTPLRVRIGVHTGPVVVATQGIGSQRERLAWGDTVNIAARLQGLAKPDTALVTGETRRLLRGRFEMEALGAQRLKGIDEGVEIFRLLSVAAPEHGAEDGARFVARAAEFEALRQRWKEAAAGRGGTLLVRGDAGMGKSRLLAAFAQSLEDPPHRWIRLQGSPYHRHSALHPVSESLREVLGIAADADTAEQIAQLSQSLARLGLDKPDTIRRLASLLALSLPAPDAGDAGPEQERKHTLDAIVALYLALSDEGPIAIVAEDLHWVDPTTHELIERLVEEVRLRRALLLATTRPDVDPGWRTAPAVGSIDLVPLDDEAVRALIATIPGADALPQAVRDEILARTDGIPLYVEEFTRSVVEGSAAGEPPLEAGDHGIPATLQDSLTARLDRLGPSKAIAQLAATLGEEFSVALLDRISPLDAHALSAALEELVAAGLLERREAGPQTLYAFRHSLLQQAAYESLLLRRRREIHERVASALLEHFPETLERAPERLARHFQEANLVEQAIEWWQRSAEKARARHALEEEVAHLQTSLDLLLERVPDAAERDEREFELRIQIAQQLVSASGLVSPRAQNMMSRCRDLCRGTGKHMKLYSVLTLQSMVQLGRAENAAVLALTDEARQLMRDSETPELLAAVHMIRGGALGSMGRAREAHAELEHCISLLESDAGARLDPEQRIGVGVMAQTWVAYELWTLGRPDAAQQVADAALVRGRADDAPPLLLAQALIGAGTLATMRRESQRAGLLARELVEHSRSKKLPAGLAHGRMIEGWALGEAGDAEAGVRAMHDGLALLEELGTAMRRTFYLAHLAELLARLERFEECEEFLRGAAEHSERQNAGFYLPELHRLRGDLARRNGGDPAEWYQRALETARSMGSSMLALRAATALARLHPEETRDELARILASIEGGAELPDLQQARALLA